MKLLGPATESVRVRQQTNLMTFRYEYGGNFSNISPEPWMGAYHSSELPMLMGTYGDFRSPGTQLEAATSVACTQIPSYHTVLDT